MVTTLVLLVLAWAVTVPVVLGLARLLGRVSGPRRAAAPAEVRSVEKADDPPDNVIALVPRPQNALVRREAA